MKSNILFFITAITIAVLTSCKTVVKVDKPVESYTVPSYSQKPSVISFTTQAKISDIQEELNTRFTGLLYEDNSLENNGGDNVMYKAWKQGNIRVDMKGSTLEYDVPLKLWIKAGFSVQRFGITLSDFRELNGALSLRFKTAVSLNQDWTVTTKTTADGYDWITSPSVKVGGIEVSVKFIADLVMQAGLKRMGGLIDESIKDYLNLKPYARQAWTLAGKPVKVNDDYNIWLLVSPQKIITSSLTGNNGMISHKAGLTGDIMLSMGEEPLVPDVIKPLPDLLTGTVPTDVTTLYAYVTLPYDQITKTALPYLKGKTFEYGKRKVVIEDLKIYGSEGMIVAETALSGNLNGTLYFKGKPSYNAADSTLVIKEFDYDISTKNFLVKSASWLLQDEFRKLISNQLKWSISKDMVLIRSSVNNTLTNYELVKGIVLNGNVTRVEPGTVHVTNQGIVPEIIATGKFGITIKSIMLQ